MKPILLCLVLASFALAEDYPSCSAPVSVDCLKVGDCHPKYGITALDNAAPILTALPPMLIQQSYRQLFLSAYFNTHQYNRPGFAKLFKKLTDESWEDAFKVIEHIYQRGLHIKDEKLTYTVDTDIKHELQALSLALDMQKERAEKTFDIVKHRDPEITSFLENNFMEKDAKHIRDFSGHITDVKNFIGDNLPLGIEIMDSYLLDKY